ncbi:unnamed protein product [Allacma fusca]|uniref:Uncharacterized protein n=1 Tax=Allacma fusca TaxID=39272 RepID=A0A8J2PR40_9HEXA|nr:unnamed protein product [Allacma fusca]
MGKAVILVFTITLISMATKMTVSQFGYGYRNWFGYGPRNMAINPLSDECFPDGTENCIRMTDCCSNYCDITGPRASACRPTRCGCPQPPWGPINDNCKRYFSSCDRHEECCSGYCRDMREPTRHGGSNILCWTPPCKLCEKAY